MSIKQLLQGKWLGHPLHPALVHVPTGLWPAALVFDLVGHFGPGSPALVRASFGCILFGLIAALPAIPTGLADWWEIKPERPARRLGLWHMGLNSLVFMLMSIDLWLRYTDGSDATYPPRAAVIVCAVANGVLFVSGCLGGRMAFEHGVGV